jgi:hypothetical protein
MGYYYADEQYEDFEEFEDENSFKLILQLKEESHKQLIEALLNETIMNYNVRFGEFDPFDALEIDRLNILWDSFKHVYKKAKYKALDYLTIFEQNQLFNFLVFSTVEDIPEEFDDEDEEFDE